MCEQLKCFGKVKVKGPSAVFQLDGEEDGALIGPDGCLVPYTVTRLEDGNPHGLLAPQAGD